MSEASKKSGTENWLHIKSLFCDAIDLSLSERASFLENCDEEYRNQLRVLIEAHDRAGEFIIEPAMVEIGLPDEQKSDFYVGKQIDSYKIIREIGSGGMGAVYLANRADGSFDKPVALKLIKRGMDTNAVLKRFVVERQILAQLRHPNIANLLDGGTTDDGLPYFVMEYVEGMPVTRFCDSHSFSIKEKLELFQEICAAIFHAHQNLVVHRDIKPSNILVTESGTPKLLDFGIAKLLHPDWSLDTAEATATMFRVMTPEYASPEQIQGKPISTASDVYSLGVVLYELLTGERPYRIESRLPEEVAREVLTAEPVKPSSVVSYSVAGGGTRNVDLDTSKNDKPNTKDGEQKPEFRNPQSAIRDLKGDLDNIILKALRKEAERRYASVQEFSEDIRRHLAGLPVTATADTSFYRLGKFVKRHRAGVFAGSFIIVLLSVATAITMWQSIIANRERDRAEQRFGQVRKLANAVLFEYHDGIKEMPGATAIREKMVKDSLEYLDNLANESDYSLDLQRELAVAYRKVGDIQGDHSSGGNLGTSTAAMQSYTKAFAIQENIVAANPANTDDRRLLARLMIDIAGQHEFTGDLQSRENYSRGAIEIFRQLAEQVPNETKSHSDLARALWTLASAVRAKGDLDDALVSYRQAAEIYENLAKQKPEDRKFIRNAALTYKNMGGLLEQKKDFPSALDFYHKALAIDAKNAADEPESVASQLDLSFSYGSVASALMNTGNFDTALDNYRKKLAIQEKVAADDTKNAFAQASLAQTYQQLGNLWRNLEKYDDAAENFQKSIRLFEQLLAIDSKNVKQALYLAESHSQLGDCLSNSAGRDPSRGAKLTRLRAALVSQKRGMDLLENLNSQNMLDRTGQETLAKVKKNWQETSEKIARS